MPRKPAPQLKDTSQPQGAYAVTPPWAVIYVKLLMAGCPAAKAVSLVLAGVQLEPEEYRGLAMQWNRSTLVLNELAQVHGGHWADLARDTRLQIALDKQTMEAAFFLWDANFCEVSDTDELSKMKVAREMVKQELGKAPDDSDPMQAFARFAMEFARQSGAEKEAGKKRPPQVNEAPGYFTGSTKHRNDH